MLREITLFGALVPSLLIYFLGSMLLYFCVDRLIAGCGLYRILWHPPLARFGIFLCIFSMLVLSTRP
ncbi:MAG TPA: DUF1656 domain-containing protein [Stellaceae bacterium]|nr:DUF1656 domain-containing protein [Stellaceae bacterium]